MTFDPLHKWLGIPASEQPPNHYRLLGIPVFEDDPEVIDAAADKQLAFLHDLTNGPHAEAAEDLSNRVSAARVCLRSQAKKAAYDAKLRRKTSQCADDRFSWVRPGSGQRRAGRARNAFAYVHASEPGADLRMDADPWRRDRTRTLPLRKPCRCGGARSHHSFDDGPPPCDHRGTSGSRLCR